MKTLLLKTTLVATILFLASTINAQQEIIISTKESADATRAVYEALHKADKKDVIIRFEKGEYTFKTQNAVGKYHPITNHDNFYSYFAFPLIACRNIIIDGGGSEFFFEGQIIPFVIENSQNITVRNLSIDWKTPFYLQAKVVDVDSVAGTTDFEINPMTPHKLEGKRLSFSTNGVDHPFLGNSLAYDPATGAPAYRTQDFRFTSNNTRDTEYEQIAPNVYRANMCYTNQLPPHGVVYICKGPQKNNRLAPAFHIIGSKGTDLNNITIYHAPGMGVIGEKSEDIRLKKVNVCLRPGTSRLVSTTADASHFCNTRGELLVEDCLFENMFDDGINVHGTYLQICEVLSNKTVRANLKHYQQFGYELLAPGDEVEFVAYQTLLPQGNSTVAAVKRINSAMVEVTFAEPLPQGVGVNSGIDNISWYPVFTFRNNIVRKNRSRSVLISSRNQVLIEGNTFASMSTPILFEGDLNFWFESGPVKEVVIRNNRFIDFGYGGSKSSAVMITPRMKQVDADRAYERNILIEGNLIRTFDNSVLDAYSVDGLVFRNNVIEETNSFKKIFSQSPCLKVENSHHVEIYGNTYKGSGGEIVIDDNTRRTLKYKPLQRVK